LCISSIEIKAQRTTNNPSSKTATHALTPTKSLDGSIAILRAGWNSNLFLKDVFEEPVGNGVENLYSFKSFFPLHARNEAEAFFLRDAA